MLIGYARTSTTEQVAGIEAQERDLLANGLSESSESRLLLLVLDLNLKMP